MAILQETAGSGEHNKVIQILDLHAATDGRSVTQIDSMYDCASSCSSAAGTCRLRSQHSIVQLLPSYQQPTATQCYALSNLAAATCSAGNAWAINNHAAGSVVSLYYTTLPMHAWCREGFVSSQKKRPVFVSRHCCSGV